jgi:MinD-like ATPase involved in chromosome partitioning or flagellar assembly
LNRSGPDARSTPRKDRNVAGRLRWRVSLPRPWRRDAVASDAELAALLLNRAPRIVVVGSRKGGVGKTSHAAGMAISGGAVLDSVGHIAAIVDANVANPDAWGQLNLPEHAATVRDVVASLATGVQPPSPIHSVTPALACYPERRDGTEYSHTDIHRLATHLRARYSLVVVDMSNRLPDPTSGPEAAVAAFWLEEADALVLPTAMSRQDFNGVLDYLDVRGRPPTVVPCITSGARRNRRHPVTREYLEVIASRVDRVLEIPDEADSVRLAGMDGVPVQAVSTKMRIAYRALTEAVARLPSRKRT